MESALDIPGRDEQVEENDLVDWAVRNQGKDMPMAFGMLDYESKVRPARRTGDWRLGLCSLIVTIVTVALAGSGVVMLVTSNGNSYLGLALAVMVVPLVLAGFMLAIGLGIGGLQQDRTERNLAVYGLTISGFLAALILVPLAAWWFSILTK